MQNASGIFDVAIGLVFIYLLLSLICSAVTEILENRFFRCRGKNLYRGLLELFAGSSDFLKTFYQNPLIYGLYKGDLSLDKNAKLPDELPSYIPPKTFALALASQMLGDQPPTVDNLIQQIEASHSFPPPLKIPIIFLLRSAQGDMDAALKKIEDWYAAMGERISGWYKKHAQAVAFVVGALLTLIGNVDTLTIAKSLMMDDALRQQIVVSADQFVRAEAAPKNPQNAPGEAGTSLCQQIAGNAQECYRLQMAKLAELNQLGLPIGWQNCDDPRIWPRTLAAWLEKLFGLLLTAIAVSLGAPFWFDVLNKFMNFRASLKPQTQDSPAPTAPNRTNTGDSGPGVG